MCQGYHRRQLEKLRRLRLMLTEVRNGLRGPGEDWQPATNILPLPGDDAAPVGPQMSAEEYLAELARVAELDKDLL